jgi:hypothetical protein
MRTACAPPRLRPPQLLWLIVLLGQLGCYRYAQVPAGVSQQLVDLPVGGLLQRYTALTPTPSPTQPPSQGRRPAVLVLHSGFSGDESTSAELARELAVAGFAVVLPAYRGQLRRADGKRSEGQVEFCRGEVDDAEAALAWLRRQDGIDPARIAALGMSHGGCIALRLAQRAPDLRALVTMSAPVAAQPLIEHLESTPFQMFFFNGILAGQLRGYVRAQPEQQALALAERSPVQATMSLRMPMLALHGTEDQMVPVEHACWLRQALRAGGRALRDAQIDSAGRVGALKNNPCAEAPQAKDPSTDSPPVEFVFLDREDHLYTRPVKRAAGRLAIEFLRRELRP